MSHPSTGPRTAPPAGSPLGGPLPLLLLAAAPAALLAMAEPGLASRVLVVPLLAVHGGRSSGALENDTRRDVYEHVRSRPGTPIAAVAEAVGVSHSTATYHLDTLADTGLVVSLEDGNKRRFFPNAGAYDEAERRCLAALENEGTRRCLAVLAAHGTSTRSSLAEALEVSIPTVNWHLDRLDDCGFLDEEDAGGSLSLRVETDRVEAVLGGLLEKLETSSYDADPLRGLAADLRA